MQCEMCGTKSLATVIFSVQSQGIEKRLCDGHRAQEASKLDASLTPYQLTGIERTYSAAEALQNDLEREELDNDRLSMHIRHLRAENEALSAKLSAVIDAQSARLRSELDAALSENKRLKEQLPTDEVESVVEGLGVSGSEPPPTNPNA